MIFTEFDSLLTADSDDHHNCQDSDADARGGSLMTFDVPLRTRPGADHIHSTAPSRQSVLPLVPERRVMPNEYLKRQRIRLEATFGLSVMEPWERMVTLILFTMCALLLVSGLYRYLPQQVSFMRRSASYYLWGQVGDERLLRHLVDNSLRGL